MCLYCLFLCFFVLPVFLLFICPFNPFCFFPLPFFVSLALIQFSKLLSCPSLSYSIFCLVCSLSLWPSFVLPFHLYFCFLLMFFIIHNFVLYRVLLFISSSLVLLHFYSFLCHLFFILYVVLVFPLYSKVTPLHINGSFAVPAVTASVGSLPVAA